MGHKGQLQVSKRDPEVYAGFTLETEALLCAWELFARFSLSGTVLGYRQTSIYFRYLRVSKRRIKRSAAAYPSVYRLESDFICQSWNFILKIACKVFLLFLWVTSWPAWCGSLTAGAPNRPSVNKGASRKWTSLHGASQCEPGFTFEKKLKTCKINQKITRLHLINCNECIKATV